MDAETSTTRLSVLSASEEEADWVVVGCAVFCAAKEAGIMDAPEMASAREPATMPFSALPEEGVRFNVCPCRDVTEVLRRRIEVLTRHFVSVR